MSATDKRAEIEITASSARLPAALRVAWNAVQGFAGKIKAVMATAYAAPKKAGLEIGKEVARQATWTATSRGIDAIVDQGKAVFDFNEKLTRFGIAAKIAPPLLDEIGRAARETSSAIGLDAREVLAAGRAYVDLAGAENFSIDKMKILARSAQASGAKTGDLAGMMYQLTRSMKITDAQMEDTMGGLINQAKDGAIEAAQMAQEFSGMMPIFARFGVVGREGAIQLGAMYQVTRDGFDSAATAATGVIRLMAGVQRNASKFEKAGVHVFKPGSKKDLRQISDIMGQIAKSPLNKDIEKLIKAFGRSEAWRTYEILSENVKRLHDLEESGRENGVVQKDLTTITESSAGRMAIAFEKMKNAIAEAFTPERINTFVTALEGLGQKVGPIVEALGKIGDAYGAIYHAGQKIRGALTPGDSKLHTPSFDEMDAEMKRTGMGRVAAMRSLEAKDAARMKAIQDIASKTVDDHGTKESDKAAVAARFVDPRTPNASVIQDVGAGYIEKMGLTPDKVAEILKDVRQDQFDSDVKAGRAKSRNDDLVDAFKKAIVPAMAQAVGQSVAQAVDKKPTELKIDGNTAAKSTHNATNRRRKP